MNETIAIDHLRRLIKIGHYVEHSRLPPERELASEIGVGRTELRKALATLEAEGKISRFVGRGTYVGTGPREDVELSSGVFASAIPSEVMEARYIIEPRLAAMAATNANQQDIEYLLLCVHKSELSTNGADWERWDSTFHRTIAQCSGNKLLSEVIEKFNKLRSRENWKNIREDALLPNRQSLLVDQHMKIAQAIEARDPHSAAKAMRAHLREIEETLFDFDKD